MYNFFSVFVMQLRFLVQCFFESLHYCDVRRKFKRVSRSVNFPGGVVIHAYFVVYFKMFAVSIFQNFETVGINTTTPTDLYMVVVQACKIEKKKQIALNNIFRAEFSNSFLRSTQFVLLDNQNMVKWRICHGFSAS